MARVLIAAPKVRLEIDDPVEGETLRFAVTQFGMNYALNKIPDAVCMTPVGRGISTQKIALIHQKAENLRQMAMARVYLSVQGDWKKPGDALWSDAGEVLIFEGYLTGVGYRKSRASGTSQVVLHLIHWLSDLNFSSALSADSHPMNAAEYTFRAIREGMESQAEGNACFMDEFAGFELFHPSRIEADLWANSIKPMMCIMANRNLAQIGINCLSTGAPNDRALLALSRIEGENTLGSAGDFCDLEPGQFYKPLKLPLGPAAHAASRSISTTIGRQRLDTTWSSTLWEKLVNDWGATFMFSVVPQATKALVAPVIFGLHDPYDIVVDTNEFEDIDMDMYLPRPLRGVGLVIGREGDTGFGSSTGADLFSVIGSGGCFAPDPNADGMVMIRPAPSWLANIPFEATSATKTILGDIGSSARPQAKNTASATTPRPAATPPEQLRGGEDGLTPGEAAKSAGDLLNRYAQCIYMLEVLRHRTGTLRGKLRFDIAPGTNLLIQRFKASNSDDQLESTNIFGTVVRVSVYIDAEQPSAETAFQLACLRTEFENTDGTGRFSTDAHPIYAEQKFTGAPLVEELYFPQE